MDSLDYLYQKYYLDDNSNQNTSSHWKKWGNLSKVKKDIKKGKNIFELQGMGFGDQQKIGLKNIIKFLLSSPYLIWMAKKSKRKFIKPFISTLHKSRFLPTFDSVKSLKLLSHLDEYMNLSNLKNILIIGDGYGFLGNFFKNAFPSIRIFQVNLGKILFFDLYYSEKNIKEENCTLISQIQKPLNQKDLGGGILFLEAEIFQNYTDYLPRIDLVLNVASFQEMNHKTISQYFKFIRSPKNSGLLYLCNRESKILPDSSEIKFENYGWDKNDQFIFDELCPWYQNFPSLRPPFIHKFDGPMRHSLVKLSNA